MKLHIIYKYETLFAHVINIFLAFFTDFKPTMSSSSKLKKNIVCYFTDFYIM